MAEEIILTQEMVDRMLDAEIARRNVEEIEKPVEPTTYINAETGQQVTAYFSDIGLELIKQSKRRPRDGSGAHYDQATWRMRTDHMDAMKGRFPEYH